MLAAAEMFRSSPITETGATCDRRSRSRCHRRSFDPHPSRRRVQPPRSLRSSPPEPESFDPHPSRRRVQRGRHHPACIGRRRVGFDPHPSRRRVQPATISFGLPRNLSVFRSSPITETGATVHASMPTRMRSRMFRSSPITETGATHVGLGVCVIAQGFDPHPSRRRVQRHWRFRNVPAQRRFRSSPITGTGATNAASGNNNVANAFRSSPITETGATILGRPVEGTARWPVSILTHHGDGCNAPR